MFKALLYIEVKCMHGKFPNRKIKDVGKVVKNQSPHDL